MKPRKRLPTCFLCRKPASWSIRVGDYAEFAGMQFHAPGWSVPICKWCMGKGKNLYDLQVLREVRAKLDKLFGLDKLAREIGAEKD
jgi:hypothetical protein